MGNPKFRFHGLLVEKKRYKVTLTVNRTITSEGDGGDDIRTYSWH